MNFDAYNPFGEAKAKGGDEMCQLVEDYAKEMLMDSIINLLKNGVSVDVIAKSMPNIPRKVIEELNEQLKTTV